MATKNTKRHKKRQKGRAGKGEAGQLSSYLSLSYTFCDFSCFLWLFFCLLVMGLVAVSPAPCWAEEPAEERTSTVGLPGRLRGLVLPGSELEARPMTDRRS